jgi:hypothetical protein
MPNLSLYRLLPGIVLGLCVHLPAARAQLSLTGQLRTRTELRDGQGTLPARNAVPALFTSQRTRLHFGYTGYRFKLFTVVQDVRVWGQDASTIHRNTAEANDGLMLHEAWGEVALTDTASDAGELLLKVGRQELVYDDVRLLGNLDWLQGARRHDLALLKYHFHDWQAHLGVAFNQNREGKAGTVYAGTPAGYAAGTNGQNTLYKSMQFGYLGRKLQNGNASLLVLKDDFNRYVVHEDKSRTYTRGAWSRVTAGGYLSAQWAQKLSLTASAYYQAGKDRDGTRLSAYLLSAYTLYPVSRRWSLGPGVDYASGGGTATRSRRFDPLYGTPHKFWGYMDYFYVADGFGNNGLVDYYLKTRFKARENLLFTLDAHQFTTSNSVTAGDGTRLDRNLGTELDLVVSYNLTRAINLEGGYCTLFATPTLAAEAVKNVPDARRQANWAYLMISLKPNLLK